MEKKMEIKNRIWMDISTEELVYMHGDDPTSILDIDNRKSSQPSQISGWLGIRLMTVTKMGL